jgi:hypothetical protein
MLHTKFIRKLKLKFFILVHTYCILQYNIYHIVKTQEQNFNIYYD